MPNKGGNISSSFFKASKKGPQNSPICRGEVPICPMPSSMLKIETYAKTIIFLENAKDGISP